MSHWTVARVRFAEVNRSLLRSALEELARRLGGEVRENVVVKGWGGVSRRCDYAVVVRMAFGNGYGVVVGSGGIEVVADDHGAPLSVDEFADKVAQMYVALAVAYAARDLGFAVEAREAEGSIVMDLVRA
ncbi:MAG: DUF1257 domain-containing protein [Thermofilaceae archaeon]